MFLHGDGIWQHKMSLPSRVGFQIENTDEEPGAMPSSSAPPTSRGGNKLS